MGREAAAGWRRQGALVTVITLLTWSWLCLGTGGAEAAGRSLIYVEGGTFVMGDTLGNGAKDELPAHRVTVGSFYLSKNKVTFLEYDAFCEATGREKPDDDDWGRGDRPVINVNWYDAVEYCNWRSLRDGLTPAYKKEETSDFSRSRFGDRISCDFHANGYRLPTEAEWEYAARGGKRSRGYVYSGSNDPGAVAWYAKNADSRTHPVGQKRPNELGLHDMGGNVWEWCWDYYQAYSSNDIVNPAPDAYSPLRVRRGGSWYSDAAALRVSARDHFHGRVAGNYTGFRLVRTP